MRLSGTRLSGIRLSGTRLSGIRLSGTRQGAGAVEVEVTSVVADDAEETQRRFQNNMVILPMM
ncbi:hypothetical protein [Galactobacter sp.]|uniref:hypothetical protein n=1 Tax=Galactobacter sp. TaxID=2676125 RepID=UPI00345CE251